MMVTSASGVVERRVGDERCCCCILEARGEVMYSNCMR
jgi:hypothetical protein